MRRSFGDIGIAARRHPSLRTLPGPRLPKEQPVVGGERYAPIELAPSVRKHLEPVQYEGDSPLGPALEGAIALARAHTAASRSTSIVLVTDASVFPSCIRVNAQLTTMAMSDRVTYGRRVFG